GIVPLPSPCVLGHEGAGGVVEVGEGVTDLAVGDHVVASWIAPCGKCQYCLGGQPNLCSVMMMTHSFTPRFVVGGEPMAGMLGVGTFAEQAVAPVESFVKIDDDVPFDVASLIGCGVMTGVGAAINCAKVTPGSSVVVFGCGGVGISAIQGARIAGAAEIVAVDLVESKREDAKRFGATHAVSPDELDAVKNEITAGEGFDFGFEVIGLSQTIRATFDAVRRGGTAVVVGMGSATDMVEFNAFELFYNEKTLKGTLYGSADVRRDFGRLIKLWKAGRLDLEGMVSQTMKIDDINQALEDMVAGKVIRTVIEL
ncbi:MAG TPA: zinc-binding dehydrogenase, partial [Acidimicrobiia bacterium]|nr:zinc-binding dehydrogenase [Acidimicrobiia bacterium]